MRNQMFRGSLADRRESYAPSFIRGSFDSSYSSSSSTASWDMLSTPPSASPRRDSFCSMDFEGLSSQGSIASQASTPGPAECYGMTAMTHNMFAGMPGQSHLYATPTKNHGGLPHLMMPYDMQHTYNAFSPYDQEYMSDATPGLSFDGASSPLDMATPSPHYFVNPTQTLFEPYQPSTPMDTPLAKPRMVLGSSPMEAYTNTPMTYFMSPMESPCHSAQSNRSSISTVHSSPMLASSAALHRIQGNSRIVKKQAKKASAAFNNDILHVAAGVFRCDFPGCESKHAFKRQEHLKRHKKTHMAQKDLHCNYCHKKFQMDRSDNYRSHVRLHTHPDKKGSRTKFFAEAVAEVASWEKEKSRGEKIALSPALQMSRSNGNVRRAAIRILGSSPF